MPHANNSNIKITEKVWASESEKWKQCRALLQQNPGTAIVAWFEETFEKIVHALQAAGCPTDNVFLTRQALHHQLQNIPVVFAEHYPLRAHEMDFFDKYDLKEVTIFSSLDEPLLKHFGRTTRDGTLPYEAESQSIVSAIKEAQDKIAACVSVELATFSQADWLMKNLTA